MRRNSVHANRFVSHATNMGDPSGFADGTTIALSSSVTPLVDADFELLIEAAASQRRDSETIVSRVISSPEVNEPIVFTDVSASPSIYQAPLNVRLRLLRGDATGYKDAIIVVRYRPRAIGG